jgi:dolichyl-phosphate beta-glucosyltransferase
MTGMAAARYDIILFCDLDQATPIMEAYAMIDALEKSAADIAIGSRRLARRHAPWHRYLLSIGHVVLRKLLLGLSIIDTQCGFKVCRNPVARDILKRLLVYNPGYPKKPKGPRVNSGFDTEFLLAGQRSGYKIIEVPVQWNYQRTRKMNLYSECWWGMIDLLRISLNQLRGKYSGSKSSA